MAPQDRGLYRLRTASDVPYMGTYGYRRPGGKLAAAFFAGLRITLSICVLAAWVAGVFLYRDTQISLFGLGEGWLTLAHLLVPVGFFCIFLTNRRYGPGYAFAQVAGTSAVVGGFVALAGQDINAFVPADSVPPLREAIAFGAAFFVASFVSITAFDGARGPLWWTAPLIGFLSATVIFAVVFFPWLYFGSDAGWMDHGLQFAGLLAGEGLLLLLPFWALRRMVPPMSGFGGY